MFNDKVLFKINPFDNTVLEFTKPKVINFDMTVNYVDNQFEIKQSGGSNQTFLMFDNFSYYNSNRSYNLFKPDPLNGTIQLTIILILLVVSFFFYKMKIRKSENLNQIFSSDELKIVDKLLVNELLFNSLLEQNYEEDISYVHNTRLLNSKLNSISLKLKTKYNTVDNPIVKTKYPKDKRLTVVSLTEEVKKILNNYK